MDSAWVHRCLLSGVVSSSSSNHGLNGVVRMRAPPSLSFDGSNNRKRSALDSLAPIAHKNGRFL